MTLPANSRRRRSLSDKTKETFLEALAAGATITHAAKLTGHDRRRFYELRDQDPDFAEHMAEALEAGTDKIEQEIAEYAKDGWDEETYASDGSLIRRVRRRDPRMLLRLREWRRPPETRIEATQHVEVAGHVEIDQGPGVSLNAVLALMAEQGISLGMMNPVLQRVVTAGLVDGLPEPVREAIAALPETIDGDAVEESE